MNSAIDPFDGIDEQMCSDLRIARKMGEGASYATLADWTGRMPGDVKFHVTGRCGCRHDEVPAEE